MMASRKYRLKKSCKARTRVTLKGRAIRLQRGEGQKIKNICQSKTYMSMNIIGAIRTTAKKAALRSMKVISLFLLSQLIRTAC